MANQCEHEHRCFDCGAPYICWNPECMSLAGDVLGLCSRCSYYVWVKSKNVEEVGICQ